MTEEQLRALIALGRETRHTEFKRSVPWSDASPRAKIIKSILGMSNIRDGGTIVIGIERRPDTSYSAIGVQTTHLASYDPDEIGRNVREFADPLAVFSVQRVVLEGATFVVFEVAEFIELPVVCRADGQEGLARGVIYTRNNVPETVRVPGQTEMREIIEMAVDKGLRKSIERLVQAGVFQFVTPDQPPQAPRDQQRFEEELDELEE